MSDYYYDAFGHLMVLRENPLDGTTYKSHVHEDQAFFCAARAIGPRFIPVPYPSRLRRLWLRVAHRKAFL